MILDVLALLRGAIDRAEDFPCSLAGTVGSLFTPSYSQFSLFPSGSCSVGAALALVRPVVPYSLALTSALAAGGVSDRTLYDSAVLAERLSDPSSYRRLPLRPSESSESSAFLLRF